MSSLRRIAASRANGARSQGPITPEGKQRSSRNATRHGFLSRIVVLESESPDAFHGVLDDYVRQFAPANPVQLAIVEEMVAALWRQRRLWAAETRIFDTAAAAQTHAEDDIGRIAGAFSYLASQPDLNLIHRYETRLHRMFQRALNNFVMLRNMGMPNEPNPISGHPGPQPAPAAPPSAEPEPDPGPSVPPGNHAAPACPEVPPPSAAAENQTVPNEPNPISGHSPGLPPAASCPRGALRPARRPLNPFLASGEAGEARRFLAVHRPTVLESVTSRSAGGTANRFRGVASPGIGRVRLPRFVAGTGRRFRKYQ